MNLLGIIVGCFLVWFAKNFLQDDAQDWYLPFYWVGALMVMSSFFWLVKYGV